MSELDERNIDVIFRNIQKQFLCCYPLHCIKFPGDLSWWQQKTLIDYTLNCSLNKQFPVNLSYQEHFLKKLISILEEYCVEVHDVIYEFYCQLQQNGRSCTDNYAFKHYIIKPKMHLTLRESKSFVAEGTTGLCSWQASLALADFIIQNPTVVRDKVVLELGAGTGLCGLIMLMCQPKHLLLSDGSSSCVELMCENIRRNFPHALEENHKFKINTKIVECLVMPWKFIEEQKEITLLKPNIILGADIVYDDSCFEDLSSAINYVFKLQENKVEMYLAATVRNEHTLNKFIAIMGSLCFQVKECEVVPLERSHLCWDRSTPVKIFKLTR